VILDWTFWLIALALVAFGFCLGLLYEYWHFRNEVRDEVREVRDLTRRVQAATDRLKHADTEAAPLRSRPEAD
jgi:hypothetical protein